MTLPFTCLFVCYVFVLPVFSFFAFLSVLVWLLRALMTRYLTQFTYPFVESSKQRALIVIEWAIVPFLR